MNKATSAILVLVLTVAAVQDLHAATLVGNPQQYTWEVLFRVTAFEQRLVTRIDGLMKEDVRAIAVLKSYTDNMAALDEPVKACAATKITMLKAMMTASESVLLNCRTPLGEIIKDFKNLRTGDLYGIMEKTLAPKVRACVETEPKNAAELKTQSTCVSDAFTEFAKSAEKALTRVIQLDRDFNWVDSSARGCVRSALSLSDAPYRDYTTAVRDCKRVPPTG